MDNEEIINENDGISPLAIPPLPTNLNASATTPSSVNLTWDSVTEAEGYRIYRATTATGPFVQIAETSETTYQDLGLEPSTTYFYTVSAYNTDGESEQTEPEGVTTLAVTAPTNVVAIPTSDDSITLTWTPPVAFDNFIIYRSTVAGGPYTQIATTTETSYVDTGLEPETTYYYVVATQYNGVTSEVSEEVSATTLLEIETPVSPLMLARPRDVRAIRHGCNTIEIRWRLVDDATRYNVYRSTTLNGTYTLVGTSYGFNFIDDGLTPNTTYFYYVVAANAEMVGPRSFIVRNTTTATCSDNCCDFVCNITNNNGYLYRCCYHKRHHCRCCNR